MSFRTAKKAISDYRKALGEPAGIAELTVYAAECGNNFTCEYGDIDGPFYDSLTRMFESAIKAVQALDQSTAKPYIARLTDVVNKANGIGWFYFDSIDAALAEAFPS